MPKMSKAIEAIIRAAPFEDSDRRRRAESLNILLLGSFVTTVATLLTVVVMKMVNDVPRDVTRPLYQSLWGFLSFLVILYLLNRRTPEVSSALFALLLVLVPLVAEPFTEIADGRALLYLALPIIVAAVILPPWSTFAFAGLSALVVNLVRLQIGWLLTPFSTFAFGIIALVSYLGARRLETALQELRAINEELDGRVEERTRDLMTANQQLEHANDRLRELDRLKSRFLSMVSHELRTPLSAIQGFAEILGAELYGPVTPGQRNALDRITSNTMRLLNLVGDLLDRARIEAGQLALHFHSFSPAALAEDVQSTLALLAQSKGLTLTATVASDLPDLISGDEARLRQILVNLINNGLKFTEQGGVALHLARTSGNGASPNSTWMLAVSDTGPGIAEEDRAAIFEPFRRVDDSNTRKEMGVGLGLSIVKDLVELMHGTITLESTPGKGSTFTIILPLLAEEERSDG